MTGEADGASAAASLCQPVDWPWLGFCPEPDPWSCLPISQLIVGHVLKTHHYVKMP